MVIEDDDKDDDKDDNDDDDDDGGIYEVAVDNDNDDDDADDDDDVYEQDGYAVYNYHNNKPSGGGDDGNGDDDDDGDDDGDDDKFAYSGPVPNDYSGIDDIDNDDMDGDAWFTTGSNPDDLSLVNIDDLESFGDSTSSWQNRVQRNTAAADQDIDEGARPSPEWEVWRQQTERFHDSTVLLSALVELYREQRISAQDKLRLKVLVVNFFPKIMALATLSDDEVKAGLMNFVR